MALDVQFGIHVDLGHGVDWFDSRATRLRRVTAEAVRGYLQDCEISVQ